MKVVEISAFINYSVGSIMRNIQKYLISNGHECKILYARDSNDSEYNSFKYSNSVLVYLNAIAARLFDNDGFFDVFGTRKLIKMIKEFDPDIIHIHCLHGYHININTFFKYLKFSRAKIIWTMHDVWAVTGHCCYFESFNCQKWKTSCNHCPAIKEYPKSILRDNSKRNHDVKRKVFTSLDSDKITIVSPCKWMDEVVQKSYLNKYNHVIINNGISVDEFTNYNNKRSKILIAVASVWDRRKNIEYVLNLSKNLKEWKVIIVGKTFNINKDSYENITFIDRTSNKKELIELYNKASIFINPTLDDNFPTVNIEAQLCGLMVLSFDTGGCAETDIGNLYIIANDLNIDDNFLNDFYSKRIYKNPKLNLTDKYMSNKYIEIMENSLSGGEKK